MTKEEITYLLERYMLDQLTVQEAEALLEQTSQEHEEEMVAILREYLEHGATSAVPVDPVVMADMARRILAVDKPAAPIRRLRRVAWWAAAAVVVLVVGTWLFRRPAPPPIVATQPQEQRFHNDVPAPVGSHAVLTLASGQHVVLDSLANGSVGRQGGADVTKKEAGLLAYTTASAGAAVVYNTLSTGRGGQTSVILADGTKVWLDATSSLRFPTAFTGRERRVEVSGQAYFDVAGEPGKPFVVSVQGAEVTVLGTGFNVKAYADDRQHLVTLVSGAVRVTRGDATTTLSPGEQARIAANGRMTVTDNIDLEEVMAWKNGYFLFRGAALSDLLRETARWYDVEIDNRRKDDPRFYGEVPRNTALSDLLKAMELSGHVKFGIEGKKIIVLPS